LNGRSRRPLALYFVAVLYMLLSIARWICVKLQWTNTWDDVPDGNQSDVVVANGSCPLGLVFDCEKNLRVIVANFFLFICSSFSFPS
jgi:hypothetical protein